MLASRLRISETVRQVFVTQFVSRELLYTEFYP